jgi:hypothetical protein
MTRIDPADDTVDRWILRWYRFDADRGERRHTTVAAFDNAAEFEAEMSRLAEQLRRRKAAGLSEDVEWITGVHHHPGYNPCRSGPATRPGYRADHSWASKARSLHSTSTAQLS